MPVFVGISFIVYLCVHYMIYVHMRVSTCKLFIFLPPLYRYGTMDLNGAARRKNATRETTNTLKAWLYEHRKNPYPTKGEKIMLAIITKMTLTQVSTWFANARRRLKKENKMTWSPRNRCGDNDDGDGRDKAGDSDSDDLKEKDENMKKINGLDTTDSKLGYLYIAHTHTCTHTSFA